MGEAGRSLAETAVCEIACTVVWEVGVARPLLPDDGVCLRTEPQRDESVGVRDLAFKS